MKINQVGIQTYQQLGRQDNARPLNAEGGDETESASPVSIEPKSVAPGSVLAVQAPSGTFADSLTTEERKALEMLFARFRDAGRFGANYKGNAETVDEIGLGRIVDVKV